MLFVLLSFFFFFSTVAEGELGGENKWIGEE